MSQLEPTDVSKASLSLPTPSSFAELPSATEQALRAPRTLPVIARSARRPAQTHPATLPPRKPRIGKPRRHPHAAEELLAQFTPVVQKIVGGFQRKLPRNVLREDLLAAGMIGLWDAIQRHGADADDGFEWYVRVRVRGAILDELRAQDWLPRRLRATVSNAAEGSEGSIPPSVVRLDDVSEFEQGRCLSLPASGETELCERDDQRELEGAIDQLPERERHIVREHYFKGVRFKDLSAELGVSEPRISQLHTRAMQRLRDLMVSA
jgi:RNA polymerase sigma factor for flagellar operon FliA